MRIEKLKQNFDIDVKLVHFPLHPETPAEGQSLAEMFGPGKDIDAMNARMRGLMGEEGLPYNDRAHTFNSRLAQELGTWADTQPGGDAIHDAMYIAYFVDNRNVGDIEVLVEVAQSVGLSADEARNVLTNRSFEEAVDSDWAKSREYGVTGVPTFVSGGAGVFGAQPYEALEQLVINAGAVAKTE